MDAHGFTKTKICSFPYRYQRKKKGYPFSNQELWDLQFIRDLSWRDNTVYVIIDNTSLDLNPQAMMQLSLTFSNAFCNFDLYPLQIQTSLVTLVTWQRGQAPATALANGVRMTIATSSVS